MSQNPRNRPPARRVVSGQSGGSVPPPPPRNSRQQPQQRARQQTNVNAPRRSDPFPLVIGGIFVVLVIGLLVLVFMLSMNRGTTNPPVVAQATTAPGGAVGAASPVPTTGAADASASQTVSAEPTPPRMPLADFKALYDDPAKRPLIIDVRAKDSFDAGHIAGAISFPESDVDSRLNELPTNKLIVAYCQ